MTWMEKSYGPGSPTLIVPLKEVGSLWVPAVGMKDSLAQTTAANARSLNVSDLTLGVHMAEVMLPDGTTVHQAAAYTSPQLLNSEEFLEKVSAKEWLIEKLFLKESEGIVLDPKTRFMRSDHVGVYLSANRFGLAEIIGYLEAPKGAAEKPFHELANEAFARQEYYKVLYYWARSFRSPRQNDDWKKAEASKLLAYYYLNFPGSRERTTNELDWMMKNHPSAEINSVKSRIDNL